MIHLIMRKIDNQSVPVSLEIEDRTYVYPEDKLFEQLEKYLNYKILVTYIDEFSIIVKQRDYIIKSIFDNDRDIPTLELE